MMKKTILIILAVFFLAGCVAPSGYDDLRLEKIGPFSATVSWTSDFPQKFVLKFGEGELLDQEIKEQEKSETHRLTLTGLKPATRYGYRLSQADRIKYFRTAPGKDGAFDLIVLTPSSPACRNASYYAETLPDIVINIDSNQCLLAEKVSSLLSKDLPKQAGERFTYGRYKIMLAADASAPRWEDMERPPSADNPWLVVAPNVPKQRRQGDEHVLYVSDRAFRYRDRLAELSDSQAMFLEIDAFEVALIKGTGAERSREVIIAAPPETKKSCLYCNRLMEAGRYLESLEWYRSFIRENEERYAVEDAYYSIARIQDEKLFDYPRAIAAYKDFIDRYPDSRRVILIKYRLDYLAAHSQHDYIPLRRFEQAKTALVRDNVLPTTIEVEKLTAAFPQTPVAEEALYWLGHILDEVDTERAQRHYKTLIERFPQGEYAALAAIALGDIHYRAKDYRQAITAYERAYKTVPKNFHHSVKDKLRKSRRNTRREYLRYSAWGMLLGWALLTLLWRASPGKADWLWAGIVLALLIFGGGLFFAWTYERTNLIFSPIAVMAGSTALLVLWNQSLAGKKRPGRYPIMVFHALSTPPAMIYLVLYHFHQLYVFGL